MTSTAEDVLRALRQGDVPEEVVAAQTPWIEWATTERAVPDVIVEFITTEQQWLGGPVLTLSPWKLAKTVEEQRELAENGQHRYYQADDETRLEAIGRMLSGMGLLGSSIIDDLAGYAVCMMDVGASNKEILAEVLALGSAPEEGGLPL